MKPLVVVVACATISLVVLFVCLVQEKNMWRDTAESCGKPTVRDAIDQFVWRTYTGGYDNVRIGHPNDRQAIDDVVGDAMGAAGIAVVRIQANGVPICIGPHACEFLTTESTCEEIVALSKRSTPYVETRCTDARRSAP